MAIKKTSLQKILTTAGIAPEKLTYQNLQALIETGSINSAYSHVKNMAEFEMMRWGPLSDTQTWPEFHNLLTEGILSYRHDSLGELLQTANFYSRNETVEEELFQNICENKSNDHNSYLATENEKLYESNIQSLKKLKINPQKQQPFLVQCGVTMTDIVNFVSEWWIKGSVETKRWNPAYAKSLQSDEFYQFICKNKPTQWPAKLNRWEKKQPLSAVFLPFDGWTLAECFRKIYEKK
ncbi:MAG: hypothetical protein Q8R37_00640 [Nanoarchaeota archaeon]|nr:hypothetical protein [Nanoarchaeota archaeon]